ncbi:MAG: hypothetical protein E7392_04095 [Ruminococcaceae bacterium]|nr:hypothetical protein [Oscillospiraceae bacterium]
MKKTIRIFAAFMCVLMLLSLSAFADTSYEEKIIEMYRLSNKAVEFMREHNVDFSVFEGAEVLPEGYPFSYSSRIESIINETQAYGFTDEQVSAYISGQIKSKPIIVGGPWDNTGRKKVLVPDYPFVINGTNIDFKNSLYPVISYNDITYFPMTWHYCRMLGVTTDWTHEAGLRVEKANATAEPIEYQRVDNARELYAVLPEYDIFVNGKKIENDSEEYPLLNFRNVTYFPLTWDFIINEFGWNYTFDSENGLVINSAEEKKENLDNFRTVGYYSYDLFEEPLEKLQTDKLTHIMYAFLIPEKDGSVLPLAEEENARQLIEKAHNDNCKVYIAVGGWSYKDVPLQSAFEEASKTPETRKKLVESIVSVVEDYGFDGVELDWEYPNSASAKNYEALILELSAELKKQGKNLTVALNGAWSQTEGPEVSKYVSDKCLDAFEFISVMSYDMNNEQHSPFWFANTSIDYWLNRGVSADKIVLGMPLYARPTFMQYRHLVEDNREFAYSDYAEIDGKASHYNGLPTLCKKTILAAKKAGGVMLFDVNEDTNDNTSIVSMIDETLSHIENNGFEDISSLEFLEKADNTDELIDIIK